MEYNNSTAVAMLPAATMPSPKLAVKLSNVTGAITNVPKLGWNDFHNYAFARAEDVLATIRVAMNKEKLASVVSTISHQTENLGGKEVRSSVVMGIYIVDSESGDTCSVFYVGQGVDKGDKAYYKAYTGALKYALQQMFLLPMGDDPEGDSTVDQRNEQPAGHQQRGGKKKPSNKSGHPKRDAAKKAPPAPKNIEPPECVPAVMFADGEACQAWHQLDNGGIKHEQYAFLTNALRKKKWAEVQTRLATTFDGVDEIKDLSEAQAKNLIDRLMGIDQTAG